MKGFENLNFRTFKFSNLQIFKFSNSFQCHRRKNIFLILSDILTGWAITCCGKGLQLPKISLGLWHNFGDVDDADEALKMIKHAFDNGITHFDLANNYGTPFWQCREKFWQDTGRSFLVLSRRNGDKYRL